MNKYYDHNPRVPVVSKDNIPLMPTRSSKARKLVKEGKALPRRTKTGVFYIKLLFDPETNSDKIEIQPVVLGLDRGKCFTGVAVQTKKETIVTHHVVLPGFGKTARKYDKKGKPKIAKNGKQAGNRDLQSITSKMEKRSELRRTRRGRRIDSSVPKEQKGFRPHRQARFNNRKQDKLPPCIKANGLLTIRVVKELASILPIVEIRDEDCGTKTRKTKSSISALTVGQEWLRGELSKIAPFVKVDYRDNSKQRDFLGLVKNHDNKSLQTQETHANDAISLASTYFVQYQKWEDKTGRGHQWVGDCHVTKAPFIVITKPKLFRRKLHFEQPSAKNPLRKQRFGGTVCKGTHIRSGDFVKAEISNKIVFGWVGGFSNKNGELSLVSIYDHNWGNRRQVQISKTDIIHRSNHLCVYEPIKDRAR